MPVALPNVYCTNNDVFDYLSAEGVDLRLDDNNLASGQTVTVTADAAAAATSISVSALQYALLKGALLQFDGAGMDAVVQAQLSAAAAVNATSLSVSALSAAINNGATAIDTGVNVATGARLTKATKYATSRVKFYCCGRYDDDDLATTWSANRWCVIIAAQWLCKRRGQSAPMGIESDYAEALEEMKMVKDGTADIEDIAPRTSGWPAFSNVTIDDRYAVRKIRVEQVISEPTPTLYPQAVDWDSAFLIES